MRMFAGPRTATIMVTAFLVLTAGSHANAQEYFGRNKVQYKSFEFQVLETEHFRVHFYPEERAAATEVSRMAERWYTRLSRIFDHDLSTPSAAGPVRSSPDF